MAELVRMASLCRAYSMVTSVLKKLGLSEKEIAVYLAVLSLGSALVRDISICAKINRGTTYDILKSLMKRGLVSSSHQGAKQLFVVEHPRTLHTVVATQREQLADVEAELTSAIPQFESLHNRGGSKPVVRFFEGPVGIRIILEEVLAVMMRQKDKMYFVYSSATLRAMLHPCYPSFTDDRIAKHIGVHVIALGEGGQVRGLDERKWLKSATDSPTFTLIYAGHVAHIAQDATGGLVGVIIQNDATYQTQRQIFEALWSRL